MGWQSGSDPVGWSANPPFFGRSGWLFEPAVAGGVGWPANPPFFLILKNVFYKKKLTDLGGPARQPAFFSSFVPIFCLGGPGCIFAPRFRKRSGAALFDIPHMFADVVLYVSGCYGCLLMQLLREAKQKLHKSLRSGKSSEEIP